jgi:signal transduction histidine kinase
LRGGFEEVIGQVRELSSEVHRLSHQLHPAKLDQLGLETAARSWCRDVTRQSSVRVEFAAEDVRLDLRPDTALCAYRVLQEALQNVVRHSGAEVAHVALNATADTLHLTVRDDGAGFDTTRIDGAAGLGLLSMRERTRLLNGSLTVVSAPGHGTCVSLELPLRSAAPSDRTASMRAGVVESG